MSAEDTFGKEAQRVDSPATHGLAITPHATNPLSFVTRGIYVGATGDIACRLAGDSADVTFVGVQTGALLPIRATHVRVTGTTATSMIALW